MWCDLPYHLSRLTDPWFLMPSSSSSIPNHDGHWGTTDDFATGFLHFSLFSTVLRDLPNLMPCQLWKSYQGRTPAIKSQVKLWFTVHITCHFMLEKDWAKMKLNGLRRQKTGRSPGTKQSMYSYILICSQLTARTFASSGVSAESTVNCCIPITPPQL